MQDNPGKINSGIMVLNLEFEQYINHKISHEVNNLKANMDAESCLLIDNIIKKLFAMYGSKLLLSPDLNIKEIYRSLSTPTELETIDNPDLIFKNAEYVARKEKYSLGNLYETGYLLSGLSYLDDSIVTKNLTNRDIIDGGAYDGETALVFSDLTSRQIYAFEPVTTSYDKLQNNITKYHKEDIITAVKYGLSDKDKIVPIASGGELGATMNDYVLSSLPPDFLIENIDVTSIDNYAQKNNLDIGLIKLDVEGEEYNTIMGAKETIITNKPILLISVYHTIKDLLFIKPFLESLNLNYQFMFRKLITAPRQNFEPNITNHSLDEQILNLADYMLIAYIDDDNDSNELQVYTEIKNLKEQMEKLKMEYDQKAQEVEALHESTSWKITQPLRSLKQCLTHKK